MNTKKIKCIAIDDEPLALELIEEYIKDFPSFELIQTFEDAINGAEFLKKADIDVLFVDIQMPDITGIDLVASLENKPIVIFTTAYRNYAYEGFELEAMDYLVKPISKDRFERAINKTLEYYQYKHGTVKNPSEVFYVYAKYQKIKIVQDEVLYIESLKDYCTIYLEDGESITTLMPLKKLSEMLSPDKFFRVHRSFIISIQKIKSFIKQKVTLTNGKELPVSSKYANELQNTLGS
ncbi:LytR/AlgR family response regulator transcription factor [Chondrinema litorale]|uniref:LytR/AlgR family response regulator transcription factor n=1 Tax=Chondrinema litorale TaxID=2994555 RepID=UPI00254350FF|nr:LytTR family DNA-binding domain-containing protein [Chondrinema litorale]UZR96866.1 LytTR family DNA-binding domain-containing protein [Chondrinema litorale]